MAADDYGSFHILRTGVKGRCWGSQQDWVLILFSCPLYCYLLIRLLISNLSLLTCVVRTAAVPLASLGGFARETRCV